MIRASRWLLPSLLLFVLVLSAPVFARGSVSLDEAVEQVRDSVGGRVISAETKQRNGQRIYNIRMLTNEGKVKRIRIDSQSGRQLKHRSDQR